jgi:hypothetical protein
MFLQIKDAGLEPSGLGAVFYLCALAVMVLCFAIAIKKCGDFDGD